MLIPRHQHGQIPACPQSHISACFAPAPGTPNCRCMAHIRFCLESLSKSSLVFPGTKPSAFAPQAKILHPLLPSFPCPDLGSTCPPLCLQRQLSGQRAPGTRGRAAHTVVALSPLALGPGSRGWEVCVCPKSVLDRKHSQSLPFLNRTCDPTAAAWAVPQTCPLLQSNLQPERWQGQPRSGLCPPEEEVRGMGLGSRLWHWGHREGSHCSSAATVICRGASMASKEQPQAMHAWQRCREAWAVPLLFGLGCKVS